MAIQLYMALYKTFHAQKNRIRPGMTEMGLSPGQPKVLRYLSQTDCCMQKDIAAALDIEPATVSQILSNMEQGGLVKRSGCLERKRADSVSITEKGMEAYEKWLELCLAVEKEALNGFTQSEREQFIEYLGRMYGNLTGKTLD
jgi:DNA-binding MarR family transcriptional regulator